MTKKKDRAGQKRRQARKARKNRQRKERRQALAKEKHNAMSRQKDIDKLTREITEKQQELNATAQKAQTYSQEVTESVTAILKKAGVWAEINKLEEDRRQVQQEAQQKINKLQGEINDLNKTRAWLMGQDQADGGSEDESEGDGEDGGKPPLKAVEGGDPEPEEGSEEGSEEAVKTPAKPSL